MFPAATAFRTSSSRERLQPINMAIHARLAMIRLSRCHCPEFIEPPTLCKEHVNLSDLNDYH